MGKFLRFIGIVLMGLTAAFTIMGGVGTTCVALAAEKYPSMAAITPYKGLYGIFVVVTVAIGVMMARATMMLVKRKPDAYRNTIISLITGTIIGVIHMIVSRSLRGSSMPVDAVTYSAVLTLIVFLLFRIPGVWEKVDFSKADPRENHQAGGAAVIASGLLAFSIQYLMASTHTFAGVNYGDAFHLLMAVAGWGLVGWGILLLVWFNLKAKGLHQMLGEGFRI